MFAYLALFILAGILFAQPLAPELKKKPALYAETEKVHEYGECARKSSLEAVNVSTTANVKAVNVKTQHGAYMEQRAPCVTAQALLSYVRCNAMEANKTSWSQCIRTKN